MHNLIQMKGIVKSYGKATCKTEVLKNIDCTIDKGEFVCILGKSGCGKTTLLNIMGLLDKADGGKYFFEGKDVAMFSSKHVAEIRNKKIGFIFQSFHLLDDYSILDNVILPMGYAGIGRKERVKHAMKLLEQIGMDHRVKYYPRQLSGGEKQRVAIARALCNSPKLILADEPTGSLDKKNSEMIMNMLKELNGNGITIIMVTHDQELKKYATKVIGISDGEVAYSE